LTNIDSYPSQIENQSTCPIIATQNIICSPKNPDLPEDGTPQTTLINRYYDDFVNKDKIQINEDLEDVSDNLEMSPNKSRSDDRLDESSPIIDSSRPENTFDDNHKVAIVSADFFDDFDIPNKPIMYKNKVHTTNDPLMPISKSEPEHDQKLVATTECSDVYDKDKEDDINLITDHILHTMLVELDKDRGINKALNNGEAQEEMPSFLTRGINTDALSIAQYLTELFDKIKQNKDTFLDSLATPLNRDPLEILGHLQDTEEDTNESESENMAFQQSVLPVDLYLENEKQRRINKMTEEEQEAELQKFTLKKLEKARKREIEGILYDEEEFDDDDSIMAEWENIHNKVIFD
jgi:hypothetical protein